MEAKIILRKGPLRKVVHMIGRKVVDSTYFPRPIIAEKAYQTIRDVYMKKGWSIEVKEKQKVIIVPGTETAEILPANNVMGLKTNFR